MPILARFTNFCDFHEFWMAVATAFLGISKIPVIYFEINSLFVQKFLFSNDTNLCPEKLNLGSKLKDFSALLILKVFEFCKMSFKISNNIYNTLYEEYFSHLVCGFQ